MPNPIRPPRHLRPPTRKWFTAVLADYELEDHHVRLLMLACEAWDRSMEAREALSKHGLTVVDRFDFPRARPEVAIERDSQIRFARLIRELDLDVEMVAAPLRGPALRSNRRP